MVNLQDHSIENHYSKLSYFLQAISWLSEVEQRKTVIDRRNQYDCKSIGLSSQRT